MNLDIISQVKARSKKVFYGWWVVVAGTVIGAFGAGTIFYGFSAFFNPMIAEFGWPRAAMAGVSSLSRLEGGLQGPIAGWLVDKFSPRRILLIGVTIAGIGFMALSLVNSLLSLYLIFGLLLSMGFSLGYNNAPQAAVARWFIRKRGRAFAILLSGNGIGGALFLPLIAFLITQFGWRWAVIFIGLATLAIPLTLSLLIKNSPEEMGLQPDGQPGTQESLSLETEFTTEEVDFTVREALKTGSFWTYAIAMMLRSFILSAIVVHQIPHLVDMGISYQTASAVLGLMILISIPGRLLFGWLGDRFSKKILLALLCFVQGAGVFIFIQANTLPLLYLYIVIYGLSYGGVIPLTIALRADLFGRRNFATIGGLTMPLSMIGAVTAPILAGYLYDVSQSYSRAFYIFLVMIVLSGVLFLFIPRPTPPKRYS
ncbi:MAG: MFS transporter [Chloroflexi bacterium]|nr:MFS transporter [Chloroflexota bacterium]